MKLINGFFATEKLKTQCDFPLPTKLKLAYKKNYNQQKTIQHTLYLPQSDQYLRYMFYQY